MGSDPAITQRLLQELETELMQVDQPLIIAMHFVPHSQFLLRHPYFERFNAFLGSQSFHELFRQYPVREVILVIATTECQQQRLTPSPIMQTFRLCPRMGALQTIFRSFFLNMIFQNDTIPTNAIAESKTFPNLKHTRKTARS